MGEALISADEALNLIVIKEHSVACIDVRSEGEVNTGAIPKFENIPILNDSERHQVGLCYKQSGQRAAIELGHRLVDGHREQLIERWRTHLRGSEWPLVTCWRGGLRSETAAEWIRSAGQNVIRIDGGTKALRNELLREFDRLPRFLVLAGPTGSGKTKLMAKSRRPTIDLEHLANHRGSAFGTVWNKPQPSQITFENQLALNLRRLRQSTDINVDCVLIEDESHSIGRIHLPLPIMQTIQHSPIVRLKVDIERRAQNILDEYIVEPQQRWHVDRRQLFEHFASGLTHIRSKLGDQTYKTILACMTDAFERDDRGLHREWIRLLLEKYYDKAYAYSESRWPREVAFEGDENACLNWIQALYV